ncbi:MAG TPA: hypothetical protein VF406_10970 [Thermodesulfobacteriota bacterium]
MPVVVAGLAAWPHIRAPTFSPEGFASGNGRIEATGYDVATARAGRLDMDTKDLEAQLRGAEAQVAQAREDN